MPNTPRHRTRRRTIRPEAPELVDLAQGLRDSATIAARAEARLADFLSLTLPGWRARFPRHLGWTWTDPALDVWSVLGCNDAAAQPAMEAAARSLFVRGFTLVRFHDHEHRRAIACACPERSL